jgi:hypothetical protein
MKLVDTFPFGDILNFTCVDVDCFNSFRRAHMKRVDRRTSLRLFCALLGGAWGGSLAGCGGGTTDQPAGKVEEGRKVKQDALKALTTTPKKGRKGGSPDDSF